jgi:5'-nucleotidase
MIPLRMKSVPRAAVCALALFAAACASTPVLSPTVELRILALNDFHGYLEPPRGGASLPDPANPAAVINVPAGGAPRLATLVAQRKAQSEHVVMVAAGDLIGASPILSSMFHDEPSIESLSMMGLDLAAVGNHEFDEGAAELRRMQNGGCHPVDGCKGPAPFKGAAFRYLAASTIDDTTGQPIFPASEVRTYDGVRVGFIGLTLAGTPDLIAPFARAGISFRDEVETINTEAAKLRAQGVQAIIVMIHEGGYPAAGPETCLGLSGPITAIVPKLDRAVDVIVSGHTHRDYVCRIDGRLVTSAGRYGTMLTDIVLTLDGKSGDVIASEAETLVVREDALAETPEQVDLISAYRTLAAPLMNRVVGELAEPLPSEKDAAGDSPIGRVIADAMLAAAQANAGAPVDLALMNPGGVRSDIAKTGVITYTDIFTAQPFGNDIVVLTMTGAEIEAVLRQQFRADGNMILHVSNGFAFAWRRTAQGGELVPGSVTLDGAPLEAGREYRVATNNFLATGGDAFTAFSAGRNPVIAGGDADALERYIAANAPLRAPPAGRVRVE